MNREKRGLTNLFKKPSIKLPSCLKRNRDRFARFLLPELESERQWVELFARPESDDLLERLPDHTLSEHHAGRTRPLQPGRIVGVRSFT